MLAADVLAKLFPVPGHLQESEQHHLTAYAQAYVQAAQDLAATFQNPHDLVAQMRDNANRILATADLVEAVLIASGDARPEDKEDEETPPEGDKPKDGEKPKEEGEKPKDEK